MKLLGFAGLFIGTLIVLGCAPEGMIESTVTGGDAYTESVQGTKDEIYSATQQALRKNGYALSFSDKARGIISTKPKEMQITKGSCNCSKGASYKGGLATADVMISITISDGSMSVRTSISGENQSTHAQFNCTSKGTIEREIIQKIKTYL